MTEQKVIERLRTKKKEIINDINFYNGILSSAYSHLTGAQIEEIKNRILKSKENLGNINGEIEILQITQLRGNESNGIFVEKVAEC